MDGAAVYTRLRFIVVAFRRLIVAFIFADSQLESALYSQYKGAAAPRSSAMQEWRRILGEKT